MGIVRLALLFFVVLPVLVTAGEPKPAGKQHFSLLESEEDFRARWIKTQEIVGYDEKRKAAEIDSSVTGGELGGFVYNGKWEQLDFDLTVTSMRITTPKPRLELYVGKRTQKPTASFESVVTRPGTYHIRVAFEKEKTLRIQVNSVVHPPITISDPSTMYPLRMELHALIGGTGPHAYIERIKVKGEAEEELVRRNPREPIKAGVVELLTTEEEFRERWKMGAGETSYDPETKVITWNPPKAWDRNAGGFTYDGKWDEIEFDVALAEFKYPGWRLGFGVLLGYVPGYSSRGQVFRLDSAPAVPMNKAGEYHVKLVYRDGKGIAVYINNKLAHNAVTVFDPATMEPLRVNFESPTGFAIRNIKLKAEAEKRE
jgi:hypothetical protein